MQCKTFCTADSYEMNFLSQFLRNNDYKSQKFRNVIYVPANEGHIFFFSYGCAVFWEMTDDEINIFLKKLHKFEVNKVHKINSDAYFIALGEQIQIHQNKIILTKQAGVMERLAMSYALAQSMKLSVFEERVEHTIKKTEHIPKSLADTGKITLSGKEIAKKMGKLFLERNSINLHTDILDTPEFFWDNPGLEPIYHMTAKDQDIKQRVDILNKRLNLIHELFQMLSEVLNSRHSSFLELIIIVLIGIEIILTIGFKIMK